jgi:predicted MFS family arabinose efflux permease
MMAVPVGVMLSFAVSGPVAQVYGWRAAFLVAAAPALVLVPALLWLKEPAREMAGAEHGPSPLGLLRIPALWWIALSGAVVNFILYSFSTFIAPFLTRYHGLSLAEAGVWSGIGSGAAGILGAWAAGSAGDRTIGAGRVQLAAGAAAAAAIPAAIALAADSASVAIPLLMLAYGLLQMYYALIYAAIQDIVPPPLRGVAMAAYLMAMYLCGGALGPLATGRLSDYLAARAGSTEAARAEGLHQAMFIVPAMSVVLAVVLWAAARVVRARESRTA